MFDWHVQVHQPPGMVGVEIYIWRKHPQGDREFLIEGGKVNKTVKDTIALANMSELVFAKLDNTEIADQLLAALQKGGFSLPKADFTAGELKATKHHLADMRILALGSVPQLPMQDVITEEVE